ncbi:MAG: S8 family serine peptidase [Thermomicrobiales bacterium]
MGRKRASIFSVAMLILLLLPLDATAATPSGPSHKIVVDSKDTGTLKQLAQSGATLLADYNSFSLWRTSDAQKQAVAARSSVKARDDFDLIQLRGGTSINTVAGAPPVVASAQQTKSSGKQLWMVQFVGPIKPAWLARLRKAGIEVVAYMPNNAYVVWLDGGQLTQLEQQAKADPTVQWTGAYHPAYRIAPPLQAAKAAQVAQPVAVTIQLYKTTGTQASIASLRGLGGKVLRGQENVLNFVNISLEVPGNQIAAIAGRADVFNVEPYTAPKKKDEAQGQIVAGNVTTNGANVVPTGPGYRQWLIDHGFPDDPLQYPVVDVVDDGIDNGTTTPLHPDFHVDGLSANGSRVVFNGNCTTDASGDGLAGHGNLNAGIVAGYNNLTGAPYIDGNGYDIGLGISPFGRVAGTKIFQNFGGFDESGCGNTDQGTVLSAYNAGAQITSNSWGSDTSGVYDSEAQAYDALTRDAADTVAGNQQMLHIFSAGNCGPNGSFDCPSFGSQTIGSPGTAKNVLTVGATENVRDNGVSGCGDTAANADNIADYSSLGPTSDGRIKPDIVAPGTHIQGPASQDFQGGANVYNGSGVCASYYPDGQTLYTWSTGTSHSAPAVAGVASLVYTYYTHKITGTSSVPGPAPSPAMLKALILNAPRYLTGASANDTLPSPNQGWGDANLGAIFDSAPRFIVDQTKTFTSTGETYIKGGTVANTGKPLRVTLVWTDAPGLPSAAVASVNNLDLEVTVGGQTYKGNVFSGQYSTPGGAADALNNVESVFLPAGTYGSFSVKVTAANLGGQGVDTSTLTNQDFALVVSNGTIAPTVALSAANVTASDAVPGGNGNGVVEPGETIALTIGLINTGDAPATGIIGTLTSAPGTITLNNQTSAYPDLPASSGETLTPTPNITPFIFTINGSQICGTSVDFTAVFSYNGGFTQTLSFSVPTGASTSPAMLASTDVPKNIPDYNTDTGMPGVVTSDLPITAAGNIAHMTVKLNITHTFDSDLIIQLVSPGGLKITLASQIGGANGGGVNFTNTVFDDAAPTSIDAAQAPFTGNFKPAQPLSTLAGTAISGTWQLIVSDNGALDIGTLDQWSLDIQSSLRTCVAFPPPTVASISPASGDKAGGTTVTIKGTNFGGTTAVMFGGQPATNVSVVDSTTITAVTPAHAPGSFPVVVTTNGTTLPPLATQFTYGGTNPIPPAQPPGPIVSGTPDPAPGGRPGAAAPPAGNQPPAPVPPKR